MLFDNKNQRELILMLIQNAPMQGSFQQIENAMNELYQLKNEVLNAEIKKDSREDIK